MDIKKLAKLPIVLGLLAWLFFAGCSTGGFFNLASNSIIAIKTPSGFPAIIFPDDNGFTTNRWVLGKKLFYDTSLSLDSSISCASCHKPEYAFSDTVALSRGVSNLKGNQNAPTLTNVAYHPYYTRLGGVSTLEKQILVPIQEHNEFNFNIIEIAKRLKNNQRYQALSKKAYGRELDYYVITRAIANFERSLVSGNSRYDQFKNSDSKKKLTSSELRGMDLFFSNATNCSQCHSGFNFTNYAFENNGLYEKYKDIGRKRLTEKNEDLEKFKVPTLRNIALTAPYMHDGSMRNLEAVINHYNQGGKNNPQKSKFIKPLHLSDAEKSDLVAFLKTLTDIEFTKNAKFKL